MLRVGSIRHHIFWLKHSIKPSRLSHFYFEGRAL